MIKNISQFKSLSFIPYYNEVIIVAKKDVKNHTRKELLEPKGKYKVINHAKEQNLLPFPEMPTSEH